VVFQLLIDSARSDYRLDFDGCNSSLYSPKVVDFGLMVSDVAVPLLREHPNVVGVFGVGPIAEMSWAFRKENQDIQAAAQRFIRLQRHWSRFTNEQTVSSHL